MAVYLINTHLTCVHLIGVQLTGVYLIGVHLTDVYFMDVYMVPNPKGFGENLQIPYLIPSCGTMGHFSALAYRASRKFSRGAVA